MALASTIARLPAPLVTLTNDDTLFVRMATIIDEQDITTLVVGLPRNMDGTTGYQAEICREFAGKLSVKTGLPVVFIDETLSSVEAAEVPRGRSKKTAGDDNGLDAYAAACILDRYFEERSI